MFSLVTFALPQITSQRWKPLLTTSLRKKKKECGSFMDSLITAIGLSTQAMQKQAAMKSLCVLSWTWIWKGIHPLPDDD
jgi:hypothetical protein